MAVPCASLHAILTTRGKKGGKGIFSWEMYDRVVLGHFAYSPLNSFFRFREVPSCSTSQTSRRAANPELCKFHAARQRVAISPPGIHVRLIYTDKIAISIASQICFIETIRTISATPSLPLSFRCCPQIPAPPLFIRMTTQICTALVSHENKHGNRSNTPSHFYATRIPLIVNVHLHSGGKKKHKSQARR